MHANVNTYTHIYTRHGARTSSPWTPRNQPWACRGRRLGGWRGRCVCWTAYTAWSIAGFRYWIRWRVWWRVRAVCVFCVYFVSVCVCLCTCARVCVYIVCACAHVCAHSCVYVCAHLCVCIGNCNFMHPCHGMLLMFKCSLPEVAWWALTCDGPNNLILARTHTHTPFQTRTHPHLQAHTRTCT